MRVYNKMNKFGVALWATGCARLHKDGNGFNAVFRAWHPVTWILFIIMIIPCAVLGEKITDVIPTRLSYFWRMNIDQLQWVTPFTKLDTLKPFVHHDRK